MKIASILEKNDRPELPSDERDALLEELVRELLSLWQTDELRRRRPTPLDEARGGLHIVEQSLWAALPAYLRRLSGALKRHTGQPLPLEACPVRFASWMGGDRDGNPNVTARVTHHVSCLARWMATNLYIHEVDMLRFELSMARASPELHAMAAAIDASDEAAYQEMHRQPSVGAAHAAAAADEAAKAGAKGGVPAATPSGLGRTLSRRSSGWNDVHDAAHPPGGMVVSTLLGASFDSEAVHLPHSAAEQDPFAWREIQEQLESDAAAHRAASVVSMSDGDVARLADLPTSPSMAALEAAAALTRDGTPPLPGAMTDAPDGDTVSSMHTPGLAKKRPGKATEGASATTGQGAAAQAARGKSTAQEILHPARLMGATPYRSVLGQVRAKLMATRHRMEEQLSGAAASSSEEIYSTPEELLAPLRACYDSLHATGAGPIAEGRLLDVIRRVAAFGLCLLKLDLRQEAPRHAETLDAVTVYLGLGSYCSWDEERRVAWLSAELAGRRPLVPHAMQVSAPVREALETLRVAAELGTHVLGAYVISMASSASDVLAVELLQREARAVVAGEAGPAGMNNGPPLRVVPLFETLKDLEAGPAVLDALFKVPWYREHLTAAHGDHQEVMLGYSDSGKDAGRLAAAWALYVCQERVVEVCKAHGIKITLFHGRGGTVGRGGGPMHLAIQSQPPGSVHGSLRVTEQGEMVQAKFGMDVIAQRQMEIFTTAVLQATVAPPPPPSNTAWRPLMDRMGRVSCAAYRAMVVSNPQFMLYFQEATPEDELGNLNIGSRPARRKAGVRDIASMRAIPWVFSWALSRSALPAWLGVGAALADAIADGQLSVLQEMYDSWPFFKSTVDLIEMVLTKADMRVQKVYEDALCSGDATRAVGQQLREAYSECVGAVLAVTRHRFLSESSPQLRRLIDARAPFINVINFAQVETLRRLRQDGANAELRNALLISINGIAAGMRNTG